MQSKRGDILSRFLQEDVFNTTYLRDIILNFVIAGKDTTAATLAWFTYMLCEHPAVQEKVAKEVKEATHTKEICCPTEFVSSITDEALERMNYLHAAITETLRLYPAVPVVRLYFKLCIVISVLHICICDCKCVCLLYIYSIAFTLVMWGLAIST